MAEIKVEHMGAVRLIVLNRPDRLNAMVPSLLSALLAALEEASHDPSVGAVVLTGAGRGFCAGGDLDAGPAGGIGGDAGRARLVEHVRCSQLLREMPKPTVAAVNGPCAGAGLALACAADLRLAAESAKFVAAFLTAGVSGDFGLSWTLPRLIREGRARSFLLRSERWTAETALANGLVTEVHPDEELRSAALVIAGELAAGPHEAIAAMKQNLNTTAVDFGQALHDEALRHHRSAMSDDAAEAASAFRERRPPRFRTS